MNATGVSRACTAAALLAVLTTTGCGSEAPPAALARPASFSDLPVDAITSAMLADMRKERFISLVGTYHDDEDAYTIRAKLGPKASCHYQIVGPDGRFEVLMVAGDAYWKFSEKALRSFVGESRTEEAFVAKATDRWIEGEPPRGEAAEFCDRSSLLEHVKEKIDDGDSEVRGSGETSTDAATTLVVSTGSITIEGHAPHRITEMIEGRDLLDFRYQDSTPIKRPRKKEIVVIPGFTPGSESV